MAYTPIFLGTTDNDDTGDAPKDAGLKLNAMLQELYNKNFVVVPQDYGAVGDGVTDDSAALTAFFASGKPGFIPPLPYSCANVHVASGARAFGFAPKGYAGDGINPIGGRPRFIGRPGATSVLHIDGTDRFFLSGFQVDGNGVTGIHGLSPGGSLGSLHDLTVVNCDIGMGGYGSTSGTYTTVMEIVTCTFGQCSVFGIDSIIDSNVIGGAVAGCGVGVHMDPGANTNNFNALRVEWCTQAGYVFYQCEANQVTGGCIDRCGNQGMRIIDLRGMCSVTNVLFRRNGRNQSATPSNNCHLEINGNTGAKARIAISNCLSEIGPDDQGGSVQTEQPSYGVVFTGASPLLMMSNCDWTGFTGGAAYSGSIPTGAKISNVRGIPNQ